MKKSVKAALWSGLAFPGAGHFYLKRYPRGLVLFVPAMVGFVLYMRGIFQQVDYVMDKLDSGNVALDPVAIATMLDNVPQSQVANIAFWVFVLCWVGGVIDSYLLGERIERNAASMQRPLP